MPAALLFDSSAVILYFNDAASGPALETMLQAIEQGTAAISVVTRAEAMAWPAHTAQSLEEVRLALEGFEHFGVDAACADEAARIRREHNVKLPDALIAATARLQGLPVVTANFRDFKRVTGLQVIRF